MNRIEFHFVNNFFKFHFIPIYRFCYHEKSACILPPGFCERHNIVLTPPKGYDTDTFSWAQYLADTNSIQAGKELFYHERGENRFAPRMKIECADLMDPRLVCVATIAKTVGRLLKVHFDGWEDEYDQWLDAESPDMYPVGWCVLVGHTLEGPPLTPKLQPIQKTSPKVLKRTRGKKKTKADGKIWRMSSSLFNISDLIHLTEIIR